MHPFKAEHLKNWLIAVLLVMNLVTVATVWIMVGRTESGTPEVQPRQDQRPEPVSLLQEQLDLSEEQAKQLEQMRKDKLALMKTFNDSLTALKKQLAAELFKSNPDSARAAADAAAIGELQGKVELLRFSHFNDLLALCTPEQKQKLKPILVELFGKRPPKDDGAPGRPDKRGVSERSEAPPLRPDREGDLTDRNNGNTPKPKTATDKVEKLSRRLGLNAEQISQIEVILTNAEERREELRRKVNPDKQMIEDEKEKIRRGEDAAIRKILDATQLREYEIMQEKRRR